MEAATPMAAHGTSTEQSDDVERLLDFIKVNIQGNDPHPDDTFRLMMDSPDHGNSRYVLRAIEPVLNDLKGRPLAYQQRLYDVTRLEIDGKTIINHAFMFADHSPFVYSFASGGQQAIALNMPYIFSETSPTVRYVDISQPWWSVRTHTLTQTTKESEVAAKTRYLILQDAGSSVALHPEMKSFRPSTFDDLDLRGIAHIERLQYKHGIFPFTESRIVDSSRVEKTDAFISSFLDGWKVVKSEMTVPPNSIVIRVFRQDLGTGKLLAPYLWYHPKSTPLPSLIRDVLKHFASGPRRLLDDFYTQWTLFSHDKQQQKEVTEHLLGESSSSVLQGSNEWWLVHKSNEDTFKTEGPTPPPQKSPLWQPEDDDAEDPQLPASKKHRDKAQDTPPEPPKRNPLAIIAAVVAAMGIALWLYFYLFK